MSQADLLAYVRRNTNEQIRLTVFKRARTADQRHNIIVYICNPFTQDNDKADLRDCILNVIISLGY